MQDGPFKFRKVNIRKLEEAGFCKTGDVYQKRFPLQGSLFALILTVDKDSHVSDTVWDLDMDEEYVLYNSKDAVGDFVAHMREEAQRIMSELSETCFESSAFTGLQTERLIQHVRETYDRELEFLWEDEKDAAIWRREDNAKWFGLLMNVSRRKFGFDDDRKCDVVNFRVAPDQLDAMVDEKQFFRGWHMNKKHWCSVLLDGTVSDESLWKLIHDSYILAKGKAKNKRCQ